MPTASLTKLDVVNTCLSLLGEDAVDAIAEDQSDPQDVKNALRMLAEADREVQSEGWHWNTLENVSVSKDINDEYVLGTDVLSVDIDPHSGCGPDITLRGGKLYDRTNNTTVFTSGRLTLTMRKFLDFVDVPPKAQTYISIKSARKFQARFLGDQATQAYSQEDEFRARRELLSEEAEQSDRSLLDRPNVRRYLRRSPGY